MSTHSVALRGREEVAEGTMAFHFDKPAGFAFKPGQAIELILDSTPGADATNARHAFSLVSAAFEPRITVATRMRDSAFKRALKALPVGSPVAIDGPFGSLTLHKDRARPAVLIAGGIGITPFMSIVRQAGHDALAHRLLLIYSNRRPEDAAFLAELQALEKANRELRLLATMTEMAKSTRTWDGERRLIDAALVKEACAGLESPIAYLAGPPAMVEAMRTTLEAAGIDEDDIRSEEFFGY
jgi:ferredoxin-NADP reductase